MTEELREKKALPADYPFQQGHLTIFTEACPTPPSVIAPAAQEYSPSGNNSSPDLQNTYSSASAQQYSREEWSTLGLKHSRDGDYCSYPPERYYEHANWTTPPAEDISQFVTLDEKSGGVNTQEDSGEVLPSLQTFITECQKLNKEGDEHQQQSKDHSDDSTAAPTLQANSTAHSTTPSSSNSTSNIAFDHQDKLQYATEPDSTKSAQDSAATASDGYKAPQPTPYEIPLHHTAYATSGAEYSSEAPYVAYSNDGFMYHNQIMRYYQAHPYSLNTNFYNYSTAATQVQQPTTASSSSGSSSKKVPADMASRKYLCDVCNKRFTRPSTLKTHMNSHTGERPFVCDAPGCSWKFTVLSNLKRHARVCVHMKAMK